MRRRAIQLSNNTLVVSLPSGWARQNKVIKGSELEVDAKGYSLMIKNSCSSMSSSRTLADISGMSSTLVWSYLMSLYRAGYGEIEVMFQDNWTVDLKSSRKIRTLDLISRIADKMIGVEILGQGRSRCVLKEVARISPEELDNLLNRAVLSLVTIAGDMLQAFMDSDKETLENLYRYSERNLNKITNHCMRILNRQCLESFNKSDETYLMIFLIEDIGDIYAHLARHVFSLGDFDFSEDDMSFYSQTINLLQIAHRFLLRPVKEHYISFHESRAELKRELSVRECSGNDVSGVFRESLLAVSDRLMELCNAKVSASHFTV